MVSESQPSLDSMVLRFKHGKSVIFLHAQPTSPISNLKAELLSALEELPDDSATKQALVPLPSDPEHIVFAIPVNPDQRDSAWVPLNIPETEVEEDANGNTKVVGGAGSILNSDPKSAGLSDFAQVAFRFLTRNEIKSGEMIADGKMWEVEQPPMEHGDLDDLEADEDELME